MDAYIELIKDSQVPTYAHDGDAGMDIRAAEDIVIKPREVKIIKTGIKIAVPKGVEIDVRPRSGLSAKTRLRVSNAPGTIDSGFKDEIGVIIENTSLPFDINEKGEIVRNINTYSINEEGNKDGTYIIKKGERIAQIIFLQYVEANLIEVDDISKIGNNRGGGFGSSGTN